MALPVVPILVGGAALGAVAHLTNSPEKKELKRTQMTADSILLIQPKTPLQRAAANLVQTLFF